MKQSLQYHENQLNQIARNIEYLSKSKNVHAADLIAMSIDYNNIKTAIKRAIEIGLDEFDVEEMLNGE